MADKPQLPELPKALTDWFNFQKGPTLNLRRSHRFRIPTFGGPTFWSDIQIFKGYRIQKHHLTGHGRILDIQDRRVFWGTLDECQAELAQLGDLAPVGATGKHLVLCLHGIFRSKNAMNKMRNGFLGAGYNAWSINYPSTSKTIDEHADQIIALLNRCEGIEQVSFVCHSMGGLIARAVLAKGGDWTTKIRPHRLVMIGTPNQGAFIAKELTNRTWAFRLIAGPAGIQLTPEWVNQLPVPSIEFGIIAGGTGDGKGFNPFLPGDDDLTVTVESTKLEDASDFLLVRAIHTFIMQKPDVISASIRFISDGTFSEVGLESDQTP